MEITTVKFKMIPEIEQEKRFKILSGFGDLVAFQNLLSRFSHSRPFEKTDRALCFQSIFSSIIWLILCSEYTLFQNYLQSLNERQETFINYSKMTLLQALQGYLARELNSRLDFSSLTYQRQ